MTAKVLDGWAETSTLAGCCEEAGIPLRAGRKFLRALMNAPFDQRAALLEMSTPRAAVPDAANGAEAQVSASFAKAYRERSEMAAKHGDLTLAQELADTAAGFAAEAMKLGWRP